MSLEQGPQSMDSADLRAWLGGSRARDEQRLPVVGFRVAGAAAAAAAALDFQDMASANERAVASAGAWLEPAYLRIERPFVESPDDALLDGAQLIEAVGLEVARELLARVASGVEATGSFEPFRDEFESPQNMAGRAPVDVLEQVQLAVEDLLADEAAVRALAGAGFDGAIFGHAGRQHWVVFDAAQARPAIAAGWPHRPRQLPAARSASALARSTPARVREAVRRITGMSAGDTRAAAAAGRIVVTSSTTAQAVLASGSGMAATQALVAAAPEADDDLLELLGQRAAARRRFDEQVGDTAGATTWRKPGHSRWMMVLPDPAAYGHWQVRSFTPDGPGDSQPFATRSAALEHLTSAGFTVRDDRALDRLRDTARFERGLLADWLAAQLEAGEISTAQMFARLQGHDRLGAVLSSIAGAGAQASCDLRTGAIFLAADRIALGHEEAVVFHELMHKHGRSTLGRAGFARLVGRVKEWRRAQVGSPEHLIYLAADARARRAAGGDRQVYEDELFSYAVEEAVLRGFRPSAQAREGSVEQWLDEVETTLRAVLMRLTQQPLQPLSGQHLVDLAYAICQMENPQRAALIRERMGAGFEQLLRQANEAAAGATHSESKATSRPVRMSNQAVGEAFRSLASQAREELEAVLFNWNGSELTDDGERIVLHPGRDGRFTRGGEGGKANVSKREFLEWLASDGPLDVQVYGPEITADAEWRTQIERLREIAYPGDRVRHSTFLDAGDEHYFRWKEIETELQRAYPVRLRLEPRFTPGKVELWSIDANNPGFGAGSQVMHELVRLADAQGTTITLLVDPGPNEKRLTDWYASYGFTGDRGEGRMRRAPGAPVTRPKVKDVKDDIAPPSRPPADIRRSVLDQSLHAMPAVAPGGAARQLLPDEARLPRRLAAAVRAAAASPAFRDWFEDSAALDEGGWPLPVFHGTTRSFARFSPARLGEKTKALDARTGFFFAENPKGAEQFTWEDGEQAGGNLMPVFLRITRPLVVRDIVLDGSRGTQIGHLMARAKAQGYDGVIFERSDLLGHGGRCFAVFSPEQIKSVTGNRGRYSRSSSDIRHSIPSGELPVQAHQEGELFFSSLERAVADRGPSRAPAVDWIGFLCSQPGIAPAELDWSGVVNWLEGRTGPVTREQVLAHLQANAVRIEEVVYGDMPSDEVERGIADLIVQLDALGYRAHLASGGINRIERRSDRRIFWPESGQDFRSEDADQELLEDQALVLARRLDDLTSAANPDNDIDSDERGAYYSNWTLPGGDRYREILLTLPATGRFGASPGNPFDGVAFADNEIGVYRSAHRLNVLLHLRVTDRADLQGLRTLFVEEIQSDWAQEGRRVGFALSGFQRRRLAPGSPEAIAALASGAAGGMTAVVDNGFGQPMTQVLRPSRPQALIAPGPFVESTNAWLQLALKRILLLAAHGGYEQVAFIGGAQSADRYGLRERITAVNWQRNADGKLSLDIRRKGTDRFSHLATVEDGMLADVLDKELAEQIAGTDAGQLSDFDRTIGGHGLLAFYDELVPRAARRLLEQLGGGTLAPVRMQFGRQFVVLDSQGQRNTFNDRDQALVHADLEGGQVEEVLLGECEQVGFQVTPQLREAVLQGLPLFGSPSASRAPFIAQSIAQGASKPRRWFKPGPRDLVQGYDGHRPEGLEMFGGGLLPLKGVAWLEVVRAQDTGRGAGRAAVTAFEDWAAGRGATHVFAEALPASLGFWQHMGYEIAGKQQPNLRLPIRKALNASKQHRPAFIAQNIAVPSGGAQQHVPSRPLSSISTEIRHSAADVLPLRGSSPVDRLAALGYRVESGYEDEPAWIEHQDGTQYDWNELAARFEDEDGNPLPDEAANIAQFIGNVQDGLEDPDAADGAANDRNINPFRPTSFVQGGGRDTVHPRNQELVNFWRWFGDSKVVDGPLLRADILKVRDELCALPYAGRIHTFGSAVKPGAAPNDLDVFIDLRGTNATPEQFEELLLVARRHYGLLDPFLRTDHGLLARNDEATAWTKAKNAKALEAAMDREGIFGLPQKGRPLVVFHGTKADIERFDPAKMGASDDGLAGKGFYFTYSPEEASSYAMRDNFGRGDAPNVVPAYVSLRNPMVIAMGVLPDGRKVQELHGGTGINAKGGAAVRKLAEDGGHDGVMWVDRAGAVRHVVAWEPEQIKSAIGNAGTFNPSSPDIRSSQPSIAQNIARGSLGTKVVDPTTGGLLRVFHGTGGEFDEFDLARVGSASQHPTAHLGFFFSASPHVASSFVPTHWDMTVWPHRVHPAAGGNVIPAYLDICNPYVMPVAEFRRLVRERASAERVRELRAQLEAEGFDGIHMPGEPDLQDSLAGDEWSADTWIAFHAHQITSAIAERPAAPDGWLMSVPARAAWARLPRDVATRAWFADSRVRRPVYHATSSDFEDFDTSRGDLGTHFGTLEQAMHISRERMSVDEESLDGARIIPAWIRLTNPLRLKDTGSFHADGIAWQLERKGLLPKGEGARITRECDRDHCQRRVYDPLLRELIRKAGYDGVVYANQHEGTGDSYIVFEPQQIRTALNAWMPAVPPHLRPAAAGTACDPYDFSQDAAFHHLFYGTPNPQEIARFATWLRERPNAFVRLYHGTAACNPVLEEGLLPATARRRNSLQSAAGHVCASVYPGHARQFGVMASLNSGGDVQGNRVAVYPVVLTISRLCADLDQLRNRRMGGAECGNSLAESLVHGHGARVRGRIEPASLRAPRLWRTAGMNDIEAQEQGPERERITA